MDHGARDKGYLDREIAILKDRLDATQKDLRIISQSVHERIIALENKVAHLRKD